MAAFTSGNISPSAVEAVGNAYDETQIQDQVERMFSSLLRAGLGGSVNHVTEFAFWKLEVPDIAGMKRDCRVGYKVWALLSECVRISREENGLSAKPEEAVHMTKALNEPAAEEAGSAGDEDALPAHFIPYVRCIRSYFFEVVSELIHAAGTRRLCNGVLSPVIGDR